MTWPTLLSGTAEEGFAPRSLRERGPARNRPEFDRVGLLRLMLERSRMRLMEIMVAAAGGRPQLIAGVVLSAIGGAIVYLVVLAMIAHVYGA